MWIFPISFDFRTTLYSFNSLGWRNGSERCREVQAVGKRRQRGNESSEDLDEVEMMGKWRWWGKQAVGKKGGGEMKAVVKWRLWWSGDDGKVKAMGKAGYGVKEVEGKHRRRDLFCIIYLIYSHQTYNRLINVQVVQRIACLCFGAQAIN